MKIALIGPGLMSIPPNNWGAIESLIWDYSQALKRKNCDVDIINTSNVKEIANQINSIDYDFIHCHYDCYIGELVKLSQKPFCSTTHYGYVKEHYGNYGNWTETFNDTFKSSGLISLSPEINKLFVNSGYNKFSRTLRNGAPAKNFIYNKFPEKNSLCLGKIEPRKKQAELSYICDGHCFIEFIGPVIDPSFHNRNTCIYGGIWTKPDLYNKISSYKSLILLSDGEAAPLVVPEALSAGLSIIVTETAAANLDRSLPFIKVIPTIISQKDLIELINTTNEENHKYRDDIRNYALSYFDWDVITDDYLQIIQDFKNYVK